MLLRALLLISVVGMCVAMPAMAQEAAPESPGAAPAAPDAPAAPEIDEKSAEVLEKFQAYLSGLEAFSVRAVIKATVTMDDGTQDGEITLDVEYRKPGAIRVVATAEGSNTVIGASEGEAYIYSPEMKQYMTAPTPPDLSLLVTTGAAGMLQLGSTFVGELVTPQPYDRMVKGATSISYAGEESIDGQACHRLQVVDPRLSYDLWITTGDEPRLKKAVPGLQAMLEAQGLEGSVEMVTRVSEWNPAPTFADDHFAFVAPEGVEHVDQIGQSGETEDGDADAGGDHALLGQPAPDFTLPLMGGGEAALATHLNKDIVILDFWATWCGPCRSLMPIISDVAKDYEDKNVVLYAVNLREDEERIKGFLETLGLDVAVAMDKDGDVAADYKVQYIPQSVIIGKDGKVQVVHVGTSPGIENQLREELDALIAGKDLSAQPIEPAASEDDVEAAGESE